MARTEWTPRGKGQISSSPLPSGKAPPGPPAPAWQEPRCHKRRRGRSAFFESMGPRRKGPVTSLAMAAAMRGRRRQSLAGMDPGQAEANGCPMTAVSVRSDRAPLEREETRGPANSRGRVTPLEGRGERGGGCARAPRRTLRASQEGQRGPRTRCASREWGTSADCGPTRFGRVVGPGGDPLRGVTALRSAAVGTEAGPPRPSDLGT